MRLIFMGAGEIALPTLRWLLDLEDHELVGIYTQPDKKVGRKQILTPPAVKVMAEGSGVAVFQPESFRNNHKEIEKLKSLDCDIAVVMAYGQILPAPVINAPKKACVNLHASILPRHRGASPIQASIRDGDSETGITLMHIIPQLDAGDMILHQITPITAEDTGGILHDRLAQLGPTLLKKALPILEGETITAEPQSENLVTYSGKLERDDGHLDWSCSAGHLERLIRAYDPWPGTFATMTISGEVRKLKIYPYAEVGPDHDSAPGTVILSKTQLAVSCGEGRLILKGDLQLEGRKRMSSADLLRGIEIPRGLILS